MSNALREIGSAKFKQRAHGESYGTHGKSKTSAPARGAGSNPAGLAALNTCACGGMVDALRSDRSGAQPRGGSNPLRRTELRSRMEMAYGWPGAGIILTVSGA